MGALWLIGMMGSGKTVVGALVADGTGLPFVDTDRCIEAETEQSITSLWETAGEEAFRDLETGQIARIVTAGGDCVVATGGGAILRPDNVAAMRDSGLVVWLTATPDVLAGRLGGRSTRPLLADQQADQRLVELLAERQAAYREAAHHTVDTSSKNPDDIAREVMLLWNAS